MPSPGPVERGRDAAVENLRRSGIRSDLPNASDERRETTAPGDTPTSDPLGGAAGAASASTASATETIRTSSEQGSAPPPPGLRDGVSRVREAATRLIKSHVDLGKTELGEIVGRVKSIAVLAAAALGVALLTGLLLYIGGWLFLGEWLFGSLGWGVLHGTLFGLGVVTTIGLLLGSMPAGMAVSRLLIALVIGVLVAVLLGSNVLHNIAVSVAAGFAATGTAAGILPALLGAGVLGVLLGVVLFVVGVRGGAAKGVAFFLLGLILGGLLGAFLAGSDNAWHVAIAIGLAVALLLWPILMVTAYRGAGIDPATRFKALKPQATIDTVKETREWLTQEWQRRRSKLGRE